MGWSEKYRNIFAIHEIEKTSTLKALFWALMVGFALSFTHFMEQKKTITAEAAARGLFSCHSYFQSCDSFYVLSMSYQFEALFVLLSATLVGAAVSAFHNRWVLAHLLLWPATIFKLLYTFLLTYDVNISWEYFHIPIVLVFLLAHQKLYFSRVTWVILYFVCATVKFDEAWILGNYFTSLSSGLPWFSDRLAPFVTNGVILFEIFTPWLLLASEKKLRYAGLAIWALFHLYSIQLVGFFYPLYCLPILLTLFLPDQVNLKSPPLKIAQGFGWALIVSILLVQIIPQWFAGADRKYTLQARRFGVGMFNANYQCIQASFMHKAGASVPLFMTQSSLAMTRCDPYVWYFRTKRRCGDPEVERIYGYVWSSVNGGPFYEIVNEDDVCSLNYSLFEKNEWIRTPEQGAKLVGYPRKNNHRDYPEFSEILFSEPQLEILPIQSQWSPHVSKIAVGYWILWLGVLLNFFLRLFKSRSD